MSIEMEGSRVTKGTIRLHETPLVDLVKYLAHEIVRHVFKNIRVDLFQATGKIVQMLVVNLNDPEFSLHELH